ncbi:hypothetical protein ABVK25_006261 [Lepraria finkii]|uniref:Uncharacterized protein n=1 Tax=Lepraria finkii TaxID=1340010 RepID=A0ABR4B6W9_9LECA
MVHNILATALALPLLVASLPSIVSRSSLPPCSNVDRPCSCPAGATFRNITTYATIGATANDIGDLTNNFFETTWFNLTLLSTTGIYNEYGATRTFSIGDSATLTEELIESETYHDGSFIQRYRQNPDPPEVEKPGGGGTFDGYWETFSVQQTSVSDESTVIYAAYRCDIGDPFDTAGFHQGVINDAISVLTSEGLLTGTNVAPYSTNS